MPLKPCLAAVLVLFAGAVAVRGQPVQISLVPVGDAGNVADPLTGYGSVGYSYSIATYDVTMGQYASFLNAVATTADPYGVYTNSMSTATPSYGITRTSTTAGYTYAAKGNSADVPVTYVSWGDACRFVNWLQNGEPVGPEGAGTTETGSYDLNGSTGSAALMTVTRSATANWVLPNVNEWYKSAYYAGGGTASSYWTYATQSDDEPSNLLSGTGTNNANFTSIYGLPPVVTRTDPADWLTPVGAFVDSPSPYGTFDQQGDAEEWLETPVGGAYYELRGGSWSGTSAASWSYSDIPPDSFGASAGFRVAYVPEPSAGVLFLTAAILGLFFFRRRKRVR